MRVLAAVLPLLLTGCTTAFLDVPPPAPPPGAAVHFRPVLAVSTPTTPTPTSGLAKKAEPDTPAVAEARRLRQDPGLADASNHQPLMSTFSCPAHDPLAGRDDPALPLLTCGREGEVYVLGPAELTREHVERAEASGEVVNVGFTIPGGVRWADLTSRYVGRQVALVFNTTVVAAPTVVEVSTGGGVQVAGRFTPAEAEELAGRITGG
ncbi:SecDF P1 head subdomain-containing protein [Actinosynnema sp. CA-248983]